MTKRPVAALTESVARQILRHHADQPEMIAVELADELLALGRWKSNTCAPLLRAYELARETVRCDRCHRPLPHTIAELSVCPQPKRPVLRDEPRPRATVELEAECGGGACYCGGCVL